MRKKKFACGWPTLVLSLLLLGTPMSAAMAAPAVQGQWSTLADVFAPTGAAGVGE
jgi:hypothetical protein